MRRRSAPTIVASSLLASIASAALAGPLAPPPGPPSDTFTNLEYKTLRQVEPRFPVRRLAPGALGDFQINQPGSYYLTADLFSNGGPAVIGVNAFGSVTIDLNGFTIDGAGFGADGVAAPSGGQLTIRNGTISNCAFAGVDAADRVHLENVNIVDCGFAGVPAVRCGKTSLIESCLIARTGVEGVDAVGEGVTIDDCDFFDIQGSAVRFAAPGGVLRNSRFRAVGFGLGAPAVDGAFQSHIHDNEFAGVDSGVQAIENNRIERNTFHDGNEAIVMLGSVNVVEDNKISQFGGAGILVVPGADRNRVLGNDVSRCDIGILIDGNANVIDENRVTENNIDGVQVNAVNNLITRNTSSQNAGANFNIAGANRDATIVVPGAGFFLAEPWANFEF